MRKFSWNIIAQNTALISYLGMRLRVFISKQSGKQTALNTAVSEPGEKMGKIAHTCAREYNYTLIIT